MYVNKKHQHTKATFMPISTTFGIDLNASTIHNTHLNYTNRNDITNGKTRTPFDRIYGNQTNEEHCNVNIALRDYIISEHREDFKNSIRPRVRYTYDENDPVHETINQKVNGEVAYVAKETFSFGGDGNNNTFTLEEGADVNIRAGQEITFLPGFTAKTGSKLYAKIDPDIGYSDVLMTNIVSAPEPIFNNPVNEYVRIVHDYSGGSGSENFEDDKEDDFASLSIKEVATDENLDKDTEFKFSLHPNPARDEIIINITGIEKGKSASIKIYNNMGADVYQSTISNNGKHKINISQLISGNYYLKGEYKSKYKTIKFVKL